MTDSTLSRPTQTDPTNERHESSSDTLFVRNSTGLVRSLSQRDNIVLAALAGLPAVYVALGVFFVLGGLPGGNIYIGGLLTIPLMVIMSGCYGLMTAAFPRSGGDYTIVTRVLTPSLGLISSFFTWFGGLALSGAAAGIVAAQFGVAPSLQTIGVVTGSETLFNWGTTVAGSKVWWMIVGSLVFLVGALAHWGGPRWYRRVIYVGFFGSTAGLVFAAVVALLTSHDGFVSAFNEHTQAATGSASNYQDIVATASKNGVSVDPGFSWAATIPVIGVFATSTIYTFFASFAGGELRQASTHRTWTRMAIGGAVTIVIDVVCIYFLVHTWGKPFITASFTGGFPAELGSLPAYFVITSYQLGGAPIAILLSLSFLIGFGVTAVQLFLAMTRILFAYSFDGILPESAAKVSRRTNAPTVAIGATLVVFIAALAYGVYGTDNLLQLIVYLTAIQLVSMVLVGIAATVFPFRRRELYRSSGITTTVAGVPLVTLFGIGAIATCGFILWMYFHYPYFGLQDTGKYFTWLGAITGSAVVFYLTVRHLRARQGKDLSLVYAEIPPE